MKNALKIFSFTIIFLFILSLFGWSVYQISNKHKDLGFITKPIKFIYTFPDVFHQSIEEVNSLPPTFIKTYKYFEPINKLKKDLIVLSTYSETDNSRSIVLRNLRTDSILKKWTFDNPWDEVARIVNPILLPDGSLIYNYYYRAKPGLFRIDSTNKIIWKNDSLIVHHGMNLDQDGNLWACTQVPGWKATGKYTLDGQDVYYNDYTVTKYDINSGKILFHKSITEILKEHNMANYVLKTAQPKEPIHLNDVQPALKTTKYYKKGDLFLSLRNMSMILQYRPSTNEIIRKLEGPFIHQHDVDFLNDSILTIFNNNTYVEISRKSKKPHNDSTRYTYAGNFSSNIVSYNLETGEYNFIGEDVFRKNKIFTENEGLAEFIAPNTYFVEEQNSGLLWVIQGNEVIYKNVFKSQYKGYHHLPNWTRIIKYE